MRRASVSLTAGSFLACCLIGSGASSVELEAVAAPHQLAVSHENGMAGQLLFPEMTGAGVATFDYDRDGDLDLLFVQSGSLQPADLGANDVLMRNDWSEAGPIWVDVTLAAGISARGYGMGVATGDFDGDGQVDLFVANLGRNHLWRNLGDGRFEDASAQLEETATMEWTTSAAFLDFDRDGFDDLYLVNYVGYDLSNPFDCYAASTMKDYCGPSGFASAPDRLLHRRAGGFDEVAAVSRVAGAGLGVAVLDIELDGQLELLVANDGQPNFLWALGAGGWSDQALLAGVAVNRRGEPEASMGLAVADLDRDGDEDVLVTHLEGETNTLYINGPSGLFDDRSSESGLGAPSLALTGFGAVWLDLEHDGRLDLAVANGAVRVQASQVAAGDSHPLRQGNQLFRSLPQGFALDETHGLWSDPLEVSRGLVAADLDSDGDRDLLVTNNNGPARWYRSSARAGDNWLGVSVARIDSQAVVIERASGEREVARVRTSGSYASATDSRVVFGLAEDAAAVSIGRLGTERRLVKPPSGRYLRWER